MTAAARHAEPHIYATARAALVDGSPYQGYLYAYPHKTAYRAFAEPVDLSRLWRGERRDSLFLYLHVPFCEMRCGFCNLFTMTGADATMTARYLDALYRQAMAMSDALGPRRFVQMAIGGGTPTVLRPDELHKLFDIVERAFGADLRGIPCTIETSPRTATPDRLQALKARGVERISIGIETFDDSEAKQLGRPQRRQQVLAALAAISEAGFSTVNIDLIYGGHGQTLESWSASIDEALLWQPNELYLYPLYVRALTGLERRQRHAGTPRSESQWDALRLACYRRGRDRLIEAGYEQLSMRHFRLAKPGSVHDRDQNPEYRCQEDNMVGLGPGARSYTDRLHYSSPYAVGRTGIVPIIEEYIATDTRRFRQARHGIELTDEDCQRRFILKSLLHRDGLSLSRYRARFGGNAFDDVWELNRLAEFGLAISSDDALQLTAAGLERSDAIGPWLVSRRIRTRMEQYVWR
jgi:oxygen-independent coproporphyrinogen-3 oxidase